MDSEQKSDSTPVGFIPFISAILFSLIIFIGNPALLHPALAQSTPELGFPTYLPLAMRTSSNTHLPAADWLSYINEFRLMAGLPVLVEEKEWSLGSYYHSRYAVKNDVLEHSEDVNNEWYTPEGLAAAQSANIMACVNPTSSDRYAINSWMQAPFHAIGILDPALHRVGFGSYREANGGLQMSAAMDVMRGLGEIPSETTFPIMWPGDGAVVPLDRHWNEYPDPLTSCPGYTSPSGLPVLLQAGPGNLTPMVSASTFYQGSTALEHCVFTETSYKNPNAADQALGRAILAERDAVVIIPREPLSAGLVYTVSVTTGGQTYSWSFSVSPIQEH